jgi:hypothetical protein
MALIAGIRRGVFGRELARARAFLRVGRYAQPRWHPALCSPVGISLPGGLIMGVLGREFARYGSFVRARNF